MKTLKIMGTIGIVWTVICFVTAIACYPDYIASSGWGYLSMMYSLALSIVVVVKAS